MNKATKRKGIISPYNRISAGSTLLQHPNRTPELFRFIFKMSLVSNFMAAPPVSRSVLFVAFLSCPSRSSSKLDTNSIAFFLMLIYRTITALTLGISLSAHAGLVSPRQLVFYIPWVFKFPFPELWRLVTSFFLTSGLGIIFDTYFRM